MTVDKIAKLAAQNIVPSEKLSLAETLLWYRLRDLYRNFSQGSISKENAAVEKQKIVKQYNADKQTQETAERYIAYHAKLWRNIEVAHMAYRQNKTIENADKFIEAVYGVKMKESNNENQNSQS